MPENANCKLECLLSNVKIFCCWAKTASTRPPFRITLPHAAALSRWKILALVIQIDAEICPIMANCAPGATHPLLLLSWDFINFVLSTTHCDHPLWAWAYLGMAAILPGVSMGYATIGGMATIPCLGVLSLSVYPTGRRGRQICKRILWSRRGMLCVRDVWGYNCQEEPVQLHIISYRKILLDMQLYGDHCILIGWSSHYMQYP